MECLQVFLKHGGTLLTTNREKLRPLHYARTKAMAAALLEAGDLLDARSDAGETPVHRAAKQNYTEVVEHLLAVRDC